MSRIQNLVSMSKIQCLLLAMSISSSATIVNMVDLLSDSILGIKIHSRGSRCFISYWATVQKSCHYSVNSINHWQGEIIFLFVLPFVLAMMNPYQIWLYGTIVKAIFSVVVVAKSYMNALLESIIGFVVSLVRKWRKLTLCLLFNLLLRISWKWLVTFPWCFYEPFTNSNCSMMF